MTDEYESRLRGDLTALANAVPTTPETDPVEAAPHMRRGMRVRSTMPIGSLIAAGLLIVAVVVIAPRFVTSNAVASASQTAPGTTAPASANDRQGGYQLVFEMPRSEWHTSEQIQGLATLSLTGTDGVDFGSSGGGPIAFDYTQIDGTRSSGWGMTSDCALRHLDPGATITSPLTKSGGFDGNAAPSDFNRWFLGDPLVHLPVGAWRITAVADFVDGAGCSGQHYTLKASVVVRVTD